MSISGNKNDWRVMGFSLQIIRMVSIIYLLFISSAAYTATVSVTMQSTNGYEWAYLRTGSSYGSSTQLTLSPSAQPVANYSSTYTATGVTLGTYIYVDLTVDNGDIFVTKITVDGTDIPYTSAIGNTASYSGGCGLGANMGWLYCAGYMTFTTPAPAPTTVVSTSTWHFDEASWSGTANEVLDSSGNGIHGRAISYSTLPTTQLSTPIPVLSGDPGTCGAGRFDGNTDGYVRITDPGTNSYLDQSTFSISAWVYLNAWPSSDYWTVLSKESNYEIHINTAGKVVWQWNTTNPNAHYNGAYWTSWMIMTSSSSVATGGWHHIAVTATSGSKIIYIDGVSAGSGTDTNTIVMDNYDLLIGTDHDGYLASRFFNGYIDEVRIYDPVLTPTQVNTAKNERHVCPALTTPTPTLEWRFDEYSWNGTAGEVVETQGSGLNGKAVNLTAYPSVKTTSPAPAIAGDPGTCYAGDFDASDGYVKIDDPGASSPLDLTTYTISAWIYLNAWPTSGNFYTVLSKESTYEIDINDAGKVFVWWNTTNPNAYASGISYLSLTSSSTVPIGQWHHVTFSNTSGSQVVYIDGVSKATGAYTSTPLMDNNALYIGTDHSPYESTRRFNGYIDEVRIYNSNLNSSQVNLVKNDTHACPPPAPAINSITVDVGAGTGSTCSASQISITILDSGASPVTDYAGTITLSTSRGNGDWSKTGTAADAYGTLTPGASDSGAASYTFNASDLGTITLNLTNAHAETLTITANDAVAGKTGVSSNLVFSENAFVVTITDSLADDVIVGRRHDFQVEMKRKDPTTGVCSTATGYNASTVKVWLSRSEAVGVAPSLMNSNGANSMTPPNSQPGSDNFTLSFVSGVANFDLEASDIGKYSIQFMDNSGSFSTSSITGGSSTFVVRPFAFYINVPFNPAAADDSGSIFTTAGTDFSVNVKAVAWSSADDVGDDGIADGHDDSNAINNADLSNNAVIASFGNETSGEDIQLSSVIVLPAGGFDDGLESSLTLPADARQVTSFTSGSGSSSNVFFDEVGVIELSAALLDGSYLGSAYSAKIVGRSGRVGRFTPNVFSMASSTVTESCTSFIAYTYLGKPFNVDYQLNALSAQGSLTKNYENNFTKLGVGVGSLAFGAVDQASSTNLGSRLSVGASSISWNDGVGTINTQLTMNRAAAPDGPFTQTDIGVLPTDSDGITFGSASINLDVNASLPNDYGTLARANFLYGRLRMESAYGPETSNLPVDMLTEYWDGTYWQKNEDDSCSVLALAAIAYPGGTIDSIGNRTITIDSGTTTGSYAEIIGSDIRFGQGSAGHSFSAPGAGNTDSFNVGVDLSSYPWLQFDWNQDSNYSDSALPTATYTFGLYRGHDRIIFWQEVMQ